MSTSRVSAMRSLKYLSAHSKQTVRRLHMTGPATFPSPLLTAERPAINLPKDVVGLRAECVKRKLPTNGTKAELTQRLTVDYQTRSFTSAIDNANKRPSTENVTPATAATPTRHFNTSRTLKAVNDSSTIDFAYLPEGNDAEADPFRMRVPLLPDVSFNSRSSLQLEQEVDAPTPMRPEISTVSASTTHIYAPSAMADVTDNTSIDFQGLADAVSAAAAKLRPAAESAEAGMVKQIWDGLLDDIFGPKGSKTAAPAH